MSHSDEGSEAQKLDAIATDRLVAEIGVTRATLYEWVAWKLLPRPMVMSRSTVWPPETLERARFIAERIDTRTFEEIAELVRVRWPSSSRSG